MNHVARVRLAWVLTSDNNYNLPVLLTWSLKFNDRNLHVPKALPDVAYC